jgi:hypothetical protein
VVGSADGSAAADEASAPEKLAKLTEEAWSNSPERQRARLRLARYGLASAIFGLIAYAIFLSDASLIPQKQTRYLLGGTSGLLAIVMYFSALSSLGTARLRFQEKQEKLARGEVYEALDELQSSMELPALLRLNRKQIDEYHVLTKGQAASSYLNSQIAMGAGFLILAAGATIALAAHDPTTKVASAAVTAVGGALAGYLGRTFIRTYERTLSQLNFFFEQPLVNSYILTAERLVREMGSDKRDATYERLVEGLIEAASRRAVVSSAERQ